MILAPVLDLAREPRWGRVEEDFGEDAYLTGQMGLAYVRGAQGESLGTDHTVVAEPKHFAGHGSPEGGTNTSPVHIGERELRSVMLKPFDDRHSHELSADNIAREIQDRCKSEVREAIVSVFGAPPVDGLGTTSGLKIIIEDRGSLGLDELHDLRGAEIDLSSGVDGDRHSTN